MSWPLYVPGCVLVRAVWEGGGEGGREGGREGFLQNETKKREETK